VYTASKHWYSSIGILQILDMVYTASKHWYSSIGILQILDTFRHHTVSSKWLLFKADHGH